MSKIQRKIQFARERGIYVFKVPASVHRSRKAALKGLQYFGSVGKMNSKPMPEKVWGIYVEGEWYPRINLSKREAANLAYAISISKKIELVVTFPTKGHHING